MDNNINKNITIREAVHIGADILRKNNIDNADYDSYALLENIMAIDRTYYILHGNDILPQDIREKFESAVMKRASHIPLQHIIGKAWFYGYEYNVNENVLIPRPDTEVLVEQVLSVTDEKSYILDMCTGSGCIIITIACEKHLSKGIGVDISPQALKVAQSNIALHDVENVTLIESDLFNNLNDNIFNGNKADVLVYNPPYIRTDVIETLSEEVKLHDPFIALDGLGDGLYFYRKITQGAAAFLKKGGWLMYEIGHDQAEDVKNIMLENGYSDISVVKDLAGLDRVVKGRLL